MWRSGAIMAFHLLHSKIVVVILILKVVLGIRLKGGFSSLVLSKTLAYQVSKISRTSPFLLRS